MDALYWTLLRLTDTYVRTPLCNLPSHLGTIHEYCDTLLAKN